MSGMSDQQEQQMIVLLGQINEKVGGIREDMIDTKAHVRSQGEKIDEIRQEMKQEGLPTRVRIIEKIQQQQGKGFWIVATAVIGLIAHRVWELLTTGRIDG